MNHIGAEVKLNELRKYLLELETYYSTERKDKTLQEFCQHLINYVDEEV